MIYSSWALVWAGLVVAQGNALRIDPHALPRRFVNSSSTVSTPAVISSTLSLAATNSSKTSVQFLPTLSQPQSPGTAEPTPKDVETDPGTIEGDEGIDVIGGDEGTGTIGGDEGTGTTPVGDPTDEEIPSDPGSSEPIPSGMWNTTRYSNTSSTTTSTSECLELRPGEPKTIWEILPNPTTVTITIGAPITTESPVPEFTPPVYCPELPPPTLPVTGTPKTDKDGTDQPKTTKFVPVLAPRPTSTYITTSKNPVTVYTNAATPEYPGGPIIDKDPVEGTRLPDKTTGPIIDKDPVPGGHFPDITNRPVTSTTTIQGVPVVVAPSHVVIGGTTHSFSGPPRTITTAVGPGPAPGPVPVVVGPIVIVPPTSPPAVVPGGAPVNSPSGPVSPGAPPVVVPGSSIIVVPGGSNAAAPGSSKIIAPNGSVVVVPSGSKVVAPDGSSVIAPGGSSIVAPSGSNIIAPDGSTTVVSGGSNAAPAGTSNVIAADGSITAVPGGSTVVAPDGSRVVAPSGSNVVVPIGSSVIAPDGSTIAIPGSSNVVISIGPGGVGFPQVTLAPSALPSNVVVLDGKVFSVIGSTLAVFDGRTLSFGGATPMFTTDFNGEAITLGQSVVLDGTTFAAVVFDGTTIGVPPVSGTRLGIAGGIAITQVDQSLAIIGSQTLTVGPQVPPTTTVIDGVTITAGPSGIVVGGTTLPYPWNSASLVVVAGKTYALGEGSRSASTTFDAKTLGFPTTTAAQASSPTLPAPAGETSKKSGVAALKPVYGVLGVSVVFCILGYMI